MGNTCRVTGIDPWETALERIRLKMRKHDITNAEVLNSTAESMPFGDGSFNLIVSNNGLNNVQDIERAMRECGRVAAGGAQFVLVQNLDDTMKTFYTLYEEILAERELSDEIKAMHRHIYEKRRPVSEVVKMLEKNSFTDIRIDDHCFFMRFLNADAFLNHSFIRFWFCDSWRDIVKPAWHENIFSELESRLNRMAAEKGEIRLAVPYVVIDCRKK